MELESFRRSSVALEQAGALSVALGRSVPMSLRPQDAALIAQATPFRFGPADSRPAWTLGSGPPVLLVHGYAGRGVQMAALAGVVAAQGFRAVFFDAGGHGDARIEKVGFSTFIADTREIVERIGEPLHAMVGHSAGGLAMMRARAIHGVHAGRYAVIAAPLFPYVPLASMRRQGADEQALEHVKAVLADQFQTTWSALAGGLAYEPEPGRPLLAVYDTDDERVDPADADALRERWPQTTVVKTGGFGHNRVLQAPATLRALAEFLVA